MKPKFLCRQMSVYSIVWKILSTLSILLEKDLQTGVWWAKISQAYFFPTQLIYRGGIQINL